MIAFWQAPANPRNLIRIVLFLLLGTALIFVSGCGGGGGGGGGGGTPSGLTYSGLTTPAEITTDNSSEIAASAYASGNKGLVFTGVASLGANQAESRAPRPFLLDVTEVIEGAVEKIDFAAAIDRGLPAALQSETGTVQGQCNGSASYSIQVNTDTGDFSGRLSFSSYCENDTTISGTTSFQGRVNLYTEQLESFTITFDAISGTSGSEAFAMDGEIGFVISETSIMMTLDMLVKDTALNKVYKIEDYHVTVIDNGTYASISVAGMFYHPDYGYVTLTTPVALSAYYGQDYPESGQLLLTGKNGLAGGPTHISLTALSDTQCQVQADTDGDGDYDDYDTGPILWTDL